MCDTSPQSPQFPRRQFFKLAGAAALGYALAPNVEAAPPGPPKPANAITPAAALDRLIKGNKRYVDGATRRADFVAERPALVRGQNPFAAIVGCADSRVAPEFVFDTGRGDLFVCRVAGNIANPDTIASLEYAVAVLNTPVIVVLGHESCGAVDAAINAVQTGKAYPGHIPDLLQQLRPAVKTALKESGDPLNNTIRQNVVLTVRALQSSRPILKKAVEEDRLRIAGGVYHLATGKVEFIA